MENVLFSIARFKECALLSRHRSPLGPRADPPLLTRRFTGHYPTFSASLSPRLPCTAPLRPRTDPLARARSHGRRLRHEAPPVHRRAPRRRAVAAQRVEVRRHRQRGRYGGRLCGRGASLSSLIVELLVDRRKEELELTPRTDLDTAQVRPRAVPRRHLWVPRRPARQAEEAQPVPARARLPLVRCVSTVPPSLSSLSFLEPELTPCPSLQHPS